MLWEILRKEIENLGKYKELNSMSVDKIIISLADFFAVWNKPFSKDEILDTKVDRGHIVKVTLNGAQVDTYENTILRDKDQLVIAYEEKK